MILKNFLKLLSVKKKEVIYISVVIGFLIFLLNIVFLIFLGFSNLSESVKKKLGFYFYIKSEAIVVSGTEQRPISLAIKFMDELKNQGIEVEYISKEDALKLFQKNFPELVETFKRYSIKNPLPDALFVVVKDEKQYQILKNLYNKYKDILYDIQGIDQQDSFTRQKQIVKKTLDFLNFTKIFLIFLIIFVVVVVVSILALIIKLDFYAFRRQIEVEKLLGGFYWQIETPFLLKIMTILFVSFGLNFVVLYLLGQQVYNILKDIGFDLRLYLIENKEFLLKGLAMELIAVYIVSLLIGIFVFTRLIKKV